MCFAVQTRCTLFSWYVMDLFSNHSFDAVPLTSTSSTGKPLQSNTQWDLRIMLDSLRDCQIMGDLLAYFIIW